MKKLFCTLASLLLLGVLAMSAYADGAARMTLRVAENTLYRGDEFTLTVSLTNDQPVSGGGVVLEYDSAVFQMLSGSCNVKNTILADVSAGKNGGAFTLETDAVVSGTIFTIKMKVKDDAPLGNHNISGTASLSVSCSLSGDKVTVACKHNYTNGTNLDEDVHEVVCEGCGDKKNEEHIWDKGVVTKKATCSATGRKNVTCTVCGVIQEKSVSKIPHTGTYENLQAEGHRFTCKKCGETYIDVHGYKSEWSHDAQKHYHVCGDCGYQRDEAEHIPGPAPTEKKDQTCTVCGRVLQASKNHDHTYGEQWLGDETTHWYKCIDCDATRDQAPHEYDDDCDIDCNVCEMTRVPPHSPGNWTGDDTGHWKACSHCGEKLEKAEHDFSEEGIPTCGVCGYKKLTDHKHEYASAHSHECSCGDVYNGTAQFCEVCGIFPWWTLCLAEGVLFVGILAFVLQKNKKDPDEDEPEEEEETEELPEA